MAQRHCQRRSALVAGVTLAALAVTGHAGAAGGSPLPVPDDPPAGATVAGTTAAQARPAARATTTSPAVAPVPTPDAPVVAANPSSPSAARAQSTAAASPPPAQPAATTTVVRTAPRTTPSVSTRRAAPVKKAARPSGKETVSKAAEAAPSKPARAAEPAPTALRVPHDTLRLALPVGALIVGRPDRGPDTGLLVLAAFMLATAAAGGFVLGIAARSAASHA